MWMCVIVQLMWDQCLIPLHIVLTATQHTIIQTDWEVIQLNELQVIFCFLWSDWIIDALMTYINNKDTQEI